MTDENFAERAAAAVRAVIQRELARIEERWERRWSENSDLFNQLLVAEIDKCLARIPERGEKGERGLQGERGPEGPPGLSVKASEVAQAILDSPPTRDMLRGEPGAKGDPGEKGEPGLQGERGPEGPPGLSVKASEVAQAILDVPSARELLRGDRGEKGEQGQPGEPGIDGKDALEISIQPDLDPAKSYPRGTFVTHMGGLLRSCRKTTPLGEAPGLEGAGWVVIVRGIASAEVEYPSERTMRTVFTYTDGAKTVTEVRYPGPLDKGVFREGEVYERGDGVTFGGSWWIAQVDAPETKPGTSAEWRLAVKKGRDGRDVEK